MFHLYLVGRPLAELERNQQAVLPSSIRDFDLLPIYARYFLKGIIYIS